MLQEFDRTVNTATHAMMSLMVDSVYKRGSLNIVSVYQSINQTIKQSISQTRTINYLNDNRMALLKVAQKTSVTALDVSRSRNSQIYLFSTDTR